MFTPEVLRDCSEKLSLARMLVQKMTPYYMRLVYSLRPVPVEDPGFKGTMGVTAGMVLYYDADWLAGLAVEQVAAALVHECGHVMNHHIERGESHSDKHQSNVAGDLAINPWVKAAGYRLPHGIFPNDLGFSEGLGLEEYYELLGKKKKQQDQADKKEAKSGPKKGKDKGDSPADQKQDDGSGDGKGQGGGGSSSGGPPDGGGGDEKHGVGHGGCGGIAGNPRHFEQELDETNGCSEEQREVVTNQTKSDIQDFVAANGRGSVPAGLLGVIEAKEKSPTIRWEKKLQRVVKKATSQIESGGMDFSMRRVSKRSHARGVLRPGLIQHTPEICFILDTSGSMGEAQLKYAIGQICNVLTQVNVPDAWFMEADAAVSMKPVKIRIRDLKKLPISGRGGTDFNPALKAACGLKPKPELIIYLTDGDGIATFKPPMPVVWCIIPSYYNRAPATWGHAIIMENEAK